VSDVAAPDLRAAKRALRARMAERRRALPDDARASASAAIVAHVRASEAWRAARTVLLYAALRGEVDLGGLIAAARDEGRRIVLPRMAGAADGGLTLHVWPVRTSLVRGSFGIGEPAADWPMVQRYDLDLALIPGVAFDDAGGRLGRGGGFYDRLLAGRDAQLLAAGVGFAFQRVERVPCEAHDARLDALVTEGGWIGRG
jgi:5-formyltetrahydrofolate cyclo-ligase